MATMTFQINDATNGGAAAVWVTVVEQPDGTLRFDVTQSGGLIGDLRGLFFDVADESIIKSLTVAPASAGFTELQLGNDTVKDLGDGANMNGMLGGTGGADTAGYDVGIEIGTSGIGKDDYRSFSFVLDSSARDLTLADLSNVNFGARLTSVGTDGGTRIDSSKLLETTSTAINVVNDSAAVAENVSATGNILANDRAGLPAADAVSVTGWSGGALGETVVLQNAAGATLTLKADGSYVLDASAADALSQGETLTYSFTYDAKSVNEATSWSTDSAAFMVSVTGKNDGPVAGNDSGSATENAAASGSVLGNDSDIDRLDTIGVAGWSGGALGDAVQLTNAAGATIKLNADGTYVLDASAADALSQGEVITQNFQYTIADNHGATSTASLAVTVTGGNDGPVAKDDNGGVMAESASVTGNVLANDFDIDRLDSIGVTGVNGTALTDGAATVTLASGAKVTIAADGTYTYDANHAFDALMAGQSATDSFQYTISDNHGATSIATVTVEIEGAGDVEPPSPPPPPPPPELSSLGLSHGYWKTHDGHPNSDDWNIAHDTSFESYFGLDAGTWKIGTGADRVTLQDIMFDQALELQGGDKYALAREAVTAVLNAVDEKNGTVYDFAYTVDEVKTMVHDALASSDATLIEQTKDLLEASHD